MPRYAKICQATRRLPKILDEFQKNVLGNTLMLPIAHLKSLVQSLCQSLARCIWRIPVLDPHASNIARQSNAPSTYVKQYAILHLVLLVISPYVYRVKDAYTSSLSHL